MTNKSAIYGCLVFFLAVMVVSIKKPLKWIVWGFSIVRWKWDYDKHRV